MLFLSHAEHEKLPILPCAQEMSDPRRAWCEDDRLQLIGVVHQES